jgi:hypothetical protein
MRSPTDKRGGPLRSVPNTGQVETDSHRMAKARMELSLYLVTSEGQAELQAALLQIAQGTREERLEGAVRLKEKTSAKSFGPLLDAAEKEQDREVKLQMLKALCATVKAGQFDKPPDMVERLEKLVLTETAGTEPSDLGMLIARQAALALFLHGPFDRVNGFAYMSGLEARAEDEHGKEHPIPRGISAAISHLRNSDEI